MRLPSFLRREKPPAGCGGKWIEFTSISGHARIKVCDKCQQAVAYQVRQGPDYPELRRVATGSAASLEDFEAFITEAVFNTNGEARKDFIEIRMVFGSKFLSPVR